MDLSSLTTGELLRLLALAQTSFYERGLIQDESMFATWLQTVEAILDQVRGLPLSETGATDKELSDWHHQGQSPGKVARTLANRMFGKAKS